jgi:hypothetical protein
LALAGLSTITRCLFMEFTVSVLMLNGLGESLMMCAGPDNDTPGKEVIRCARGRQDDFFPKAQNMKQTQI